MKKEDASYGLFLRAQKHVIGLADGFQLGLKILIILKPLGDLGLQIGSNTELFGDAARIADGEDTSGMAFAAIAFGTTGLMVNGATKERAAEDLGDRREAGSEFAAESQRLLTFHHY